MKQLVLIAFLVGVSAAMGVAQTRTEQKSFRVDNNDTVTLDLKFGEKIKVKAWDKDEVAFKADVKINNGKLNDALKFEYNERGGGLKISTDYDQERLKKGRPEDCPQNYSNYSWSDDGGDHYAVCSDIAYEVYVPRNVDLRIKTISGNIEMTGLSGPVRAKSISGFVDLSWPGQTAAQFDLKTISGEAYTDIDGLTFKNKKDHIPLVGYKINAQLQSGGPHVSLESISGNIYLRKS